jgi:penicillin-binding protein 2
MRLNRLDHDDINALKKRFDITTVVVITFIAIVVVRLWFLQIYRGDDFERLADTNRVRIINIPAPRGNFLDREGRIIVSNRPSFNIMWNREDSPNPDEIIKRIARIVNEDIATILERVREAADNPNHIPIKLKEDIDWSTVAYIENNRFDLPGIRIDVEPMRKYPYGSMASHLFGYLGEINQKELDEHGPDEYMKGDQIGKMGLEKLLEQSLRGEKGQRYLEVNARGFEQRRLDTQPPLPGNDIKLTIDLDLQQTAMQAMEGKAGAVVAMEVATGRLLALSSAPNIALQDFAGGISTKVWKEHLNNHLKPLMNKSIQGQYPPGSTYKMITALAGLAEGVISPSTSYTCTGSIRFGDRRYGCWKREGHGKVDLHRALAESCDVYFYQVGQLLGVDKLAKYASALGLGEKTGIILEHEKGGLVPTRAWKKRTKRVSWQKGETMSVAIGQGFNLATPLQICRMTAAIANDGITYLPQLIEQITDPDGKIVQSFSPVIIGTVESGKKYLPLIIDALVSAVNDKHGTGGMARMEHIVVGGKTGTAQVVRLEKFKNVDAEDIPYRYRDHAWFTCFAPADKPEIAVTVLVEHGGHGGSAAAPVARKILEKYFSKKQEKENSDTPPLATET